MDTKSFELFLQTSSGLYASQVMRVRTFTLEQIFAAVQDAANQAAPFLEDGVMYKTKKFFDPTNWFKWFTWEHRVAGMCMKFLVQKKLVPLYPHQTLSGKGTALYRTQPSPVPKQTIKVVRCRRVGGVLQLVR